jgi:hypothetical protein
MAIVNYTIESLYGPKLTFWRAEEECSYRSARRLETVVVPYFSQADFTNGKSALRQHAIVVAIEGEDYEAVQNATDKWAAIEKILVTKPQFEGAVYQGE